MGVPQLSQNACSRGAPLSAIFVEMCGVPEVMRKVPGRADMLARNGAPVSTWQSVQWQMLTEAGSTTAS